MKIKTGDTVLVITGKYKNETANIKNKGEVLRVLPKDNKIVVKGINMVTKHVKPRKAGQPGGRIQQEAAFDASNVMVICPKCDKAVRVAYKVEAGENGKVVKTRVCRKCGAGLDK